MDFIRNDETLDDLQLKGINIIQKKKAFRFGVDAVLLANFAIVKRDHKVVDLCTGTGIVPFIIAGKTECKDIKGIEIQEEFVEMANRSALFNKLEGRMKFYTEDLKNIDFLKTISNVDVVTVNPPYKLANSGLISNSDKNAIARHEILCTLEDVVIAAKVLLRDNGRIYMVHRPDRLCDIFNIMRKHKIEPKRIQMVHPSMGKAPNIVLVEGQKFGGAFLKWDDPLYIHKEDGSYTDEINKIYGRDMAYEIK